MEGSIRRKREKENDIEKERKREGMNKKEGIKIAGVKEMKREEKGEKVSGKKKERVR